MFRLTGNGVKRLSDNALIPNDPANSDWQKYQQWKSEGNTPEPIPELIVSEKDYVNAAQQLMDSKAQSYNYDNVFTAISYENDAHPKFHNEAVAFKAWRSKVWLASYDLLAKVANGEVEQPTVDEFVNLLPAFVAPEA